MHLIIKAASAQNATLFATANGISLDSAVQLHENEFICKADDRFRSKAIVWFCACTGRAPFPRGALLWHS